jgi:Holliday junction DNA helicase RuvA
MIYCLTGELIFLDALNYTAVIDCAGVGYKVTVTANTLTKLSPLTDKEVRVYTHMQISEANGVELFGFFDTDELEAFKLLITVSGIGPKGAVAVLSAMDPMQLSLAIAAEDSRAISRAQGIGAKTAARIVLELHDKVAKMAGVVPSSLGDAAPRKGGSAGGGKLADATDALAVLGYSRSEIAAAMKNVNMEDPLEDIIKSALAALMR